MSILLIIGDSFKECFAEQKVDTENGFIVTLKAYRAGYESITLGFKAETDNSELTVKCLRNKSGKDMCYVLNGTGVWIRNISNETFEKYIFGKDGKLIERSTWVRKADGKVYKLPSQRKKSK